MCQGFYLYYDILLTTPLKTGTIIILPLEMKKLRHRGVSSNLPKVTQLEVVKLEFR